MFWLLRMAPRITRHETALHNPSLTALYEVFHTTDRKTLHNLRMLMFGPQAGRGGEGRGAR